MQLKTQNSKPLTALRALTLKTMLFFTLLAGVSLKGKAQTYTYNLPVKMYHLTGCSCLNNIRVRFELVFCEDCNNEATCIYTHEFSTNFIGLNGMTSDPTNIVSIPGIPDGYVLCPEKSKINLCILTYHGDDESYHPCHCYDWKPLAPDGSFSLFSVPMVNSCCTSTVWCISYLRFTFDALSGVSLYYP